jgi:hypothetical protein
MRPAAVGFRVHSGWAALVAVALDNGAPAVLLRARPHLVKTFTYEFRQPYHTAERRAAAQPERIISQAKTEATTLAYQAIHRAQTALKEQDYELKHAALLLGSGRPLPELPKILASHALIHTADGELFREALIHASVRCGCSMFTAKEKELLQTASAELHLACDEVLSRLGSLGAGLGAPWTQDEKLALLAGWLSLVHRPEATPV